MNSAFIVSKTPVNVDLSWVLERCGIHTMGSFPRRWWERRLKVRAAMKWHGQASASHHGGLIVCLVVVKRHG